MCAQHGRDLGGVSPPVSWPQRAKRSATARGRPSVGRKRGAQTARRWTRTGYKATPARASRQWTAKLLWPRSGGVNPAVVRGRIVPLPGEISSCARKGGGASRRREVSRGRSSRSRAKDRTRRESKRMVVGGAWHQKSERSERPTEAHGEAGRPHGSGEAPPAYRRKATQAA